jgi:hypothetical protein
MIGTEDRLVALCDQPVKHLTGIDFIQIVNPHVQTQLRVFFIIDPDTLVNPLAVINAPFPANQVDIRSVSNGDLPLVVPVTSAVWRSVATPAGNRTVLALQVAAPGGFSLYRLTILDPPNNRVDRFFNGVEFSFKQGCPSVFDCRRTPECPPEDLTDFPVDYLARDFESLRNALLDFAALRYPLWRERVPADNGAMIMELAAALGDELAFIQDRIAREGALPTIAERRSLWWHTQLVDYVPDEGASATTWLDIWMAAGVQQNVDPPTRVWAAPEGEPPIPFEVGTGLNDASHYFLCDQWNSLPVYVPDDSQPCLPVGATELYVVGWAPTAAQILPAVLPDPTQFWLDPNKPRPLLIHTEPSEPAEPRRRFLVHVTEIEQTVDPLVLQGGNPIPITRIAWGPDEALPFELCLADAWVDANIVPAIAGETFREYFAIANTQSVPPAVLDPVALAVERAGPLNAIDGTRPPTYLYSLTQTETRGIGRVAGVPEVQLDQITIAAPIRWTYNETPIDALATDAAYTLDFGTWREVISFDRPGERIVHIDRASGQGLTIRFGDGDFGRVPADGTVFRARYRTDVGTRPNLSADSVNVITDLVPNTSAPAPNLTGIAVRVTNPFAITSGRDAQDMDTVKQIAPQAYQANPRRAVRDEDYRVIAEEEAWVQRAGAVRRWTGSWLTEFVTPDPKGTTVLSPENRAMLEKEMNCVRQAGRPIVVRDPIYRPVDLRIRICVTGDAYEGEVRERVMLALCGPAPPGRPLPFFAPDHFTFGTPLYRAALEAAVQNVPGVLAVEDIRLRVRGLFDWEEFPGFFFRPGDDRIVRLDNDPNHPESGSLFVSTQDIS